MKAMTLQGRSILQGAILLVSLATAGSVLGQDAIRSSLVTERAAAARNAALQADQYNFLWGPFNASLSAGLGYEFNDNVTLTEKNRQSDHLLRPTFGISSHWPITELNRLTLDLNMGYVHYFDNSDLNYFLLSPGSEVSFDVYVGDFIVNLHDRMSHTQDPITEATVSNTGDFGRFENTAGIAVIGDLNQLVVGFGYDYYLYRATRSLFEALDRSSHLFHGRAGLKLNPTTVVGLEVGAGLTDYDRSILNDYTHYSVGPYYAAELTPNLQVRLGAGYLRYNYDTSGRIADTDDQSSLYGDASVSHRVNEAFSHVLSLSYQTQPSTQANFLEIFAVRETLQFALYGGWSVSVPLFYEWGDESGPTGEELRRFGAGVNVGYQVMEKLFTSVGYQYVTKNSDRALRSYHQNRVTVDLTYRF